MQPKVFGPGVEGAQPSLDVGQLPDVASTVSTLRHAMEAMNVDPAAPLASGGAVGDDASWLNKLTNWI